MKITTTIRVDELAEGDRLANDHIVFSISPSVSKRGHITIGAGHDGHVYAEVFAPDAPINIVRFERRDCTCRHGIAQHAPSNEQLACLLPTCDCTSYTAKAAQ